MRAVSVRRRRLIVLGAVALAAACAGMASGQPEMAAKPSAAAPLDLKLMTYNIRYGTAPDGENAWDKRKDLLVETIRSQNPDILCLQEALKGQLDYLGEELSHYSQVGVGRDDGKTAGEYAAILFRLSRFEAVASGTFWLSDTPEVAGSKSWGNNVVRICTWARLREKAESCPVGQPGAAMTTTTKPGPAFWVYNVHLDHESQNSRARSVELLAERIASRKDGAAEPVIVCGDFNAGESNPAVPYMTGRADRASEDDGSGRKVAASPRLVDSYRVLNPEETTVGTFNGFKPVNDPNATRGEKIDYIFVQSRPACEVVSASIDRTQRNGRFGSDHFAVVADVKLWPRQ